MTGLGVAVLSVDEVRFGLCRDVTLASNVPYDRIPHSNIILLPGA